MNKNCSFKCNITRMHSSRMRTARVLTVSLSMLCGGGCTWSRGGVPGQGVYLVLGGVPGPRGVCCQGVVPGPGGCSCSWGGVPGSGGCTWSQGGLLLGVYLVLVGSAPGGCTWSRGVPGPRGVYLVLGGVCSGGCTWSQGGIKYSPCEQNHTHL